ncbi:MAG: ParB N-terminal domain-containing protein [Clostridia bacterium]|nr:ParB N-terminal domain-containing protein [Clostridia bacterium]
MLFRKIKLFSQHQKDKEAQKEATARLVEERLEALREHYTVHMIEIERICPPEAGREPDTPEDLKELCDSIRKNGLLVPLSVRRICPDHSSLGGIFALVDGSRRFKALKELGIRKAPCVICQLTAAALPVALASSLLHTRSLDPFEMSAILEELRSDRLLSDDRLASALSMDSAQIAVYRSLSRLEPDEQTLCRSAQLPLYILERLAAMENTAERKRWLVETVHTLRTLFPEDRQNAEGYAPAQKRKMLFSDVRPFFNSIDMMTRRLRDGGVTATGRVSENEDYYEYTLRIYKESTVRMVHNSADHSKGA